MEEKLSVLEAVGAIKGFVFKTFSHGAKDKSFPSDCSTTQKTPVTFQNNEITNMNSPKPTVNHSSILKNNEDLNEGKPGSINTLEGGIEEEEEKEEKKEVEETKILNDLSNKMEEDSLTKLPVKNNIFSNNKIINPVDNISLNKEKTEKCDSFDCTQGLISLSDFNKLGNTMFGPNNIVSSENEDFFKENISKDNKIPSAVQEWINHLPLKNGGLKNNSECIESKNENQEEVNPVTAKLSREASIQSNSSLDSILDSRRPDPVEIFLNLGFGGVPGVNMENCRIPKRFLVPSKCKGGDWNEFLKRELIQAQNFEYSSLGFRGLSGPSYRRPSAIVANIMEKLRESSIGTPSPRSRFSMVAKRVLNEKSVLSRMTSESPSVLSPDNREFLQNQGKLSPEVPRRRIIFGQKSFAFAHDGEFIEVESSGALHDTAKDNPVPVKSNSEEEDTPGLTNPDVLLKLRRSSLQKQKKVEEDADVEDVFYLVGKVENSEEPDPSFKKCSKKAGKIPRRFFSSSNLKSLEIESERTKGSDAMRLEVEKEIKALSQKIKNISNQDLASVLEQVKQLRSKLESTEDGTSEV